MSITVHYLDAGSYRSAHTLEALAAALAAPQGALWIDTDEQTSAIERFLVERLGVHPLAVEDIYSEYMAPKVEEYADYLYIVMHGVRSDGNEPTRFLSIEIDVVIGPTWVFTHHAGDVPAMAAVVAELKRNPRLLQRGPAMIAHAIIDRLTDEYLPVVDRLEEEIDTLEQRVIERPEPAYLSSLFGLKRSLQRLRRVSAYQRDILQRLSRQEFPIIPEAALPFYRDVYDHFVRIADLADSYRELVTAALEIYMSVVANRTNDIMKVLTLISTLMLPLTFIAGVYGMNFEHMPELKWRLGYPLVLGLMVIVALAMVAYFVQRGWLGKRDFLGDLPMPRLKSADRATR